MPSLDRNPSDALIDLLADSRRDLRESRTVRRRTAEGLYVYKPATNQVIPGATNTVVTMPSQYYSNPPGTWDASTSSFTPNASGIFHVRLSYYWTSVASGPVSVFFSNPSLPSYDRSLGARLYAANNLDTVVSCTGVLRSTQSYSPFVWVAGGGTINDAVLTIQRLSDLPEDIG